MRRQGCKHPRKYRVAATSTFYRFFERTSYDTSLARHDKMASTHMHCSHIPASERATALTSGRLSKQLSRLRCQFSHSIAAAAARHHDLAVDARGNRRRRRASPSRRVPGGPAEHLVGEGARVCAGVCCCERTAASVEGRRGRRPLHSARGLSRPRPQAAPAARPRRRVAASMGEVAPAHPQRRPPRDADGGLGGRFVRPDAACQCPSAPPPCSWESRSSMAPQGHPLLRRQRHPLADSAGGGEHQPWRRADHLDAQPLRVAITCRFRLACSLMGRQHHLCLRRFRYG